MLAHPELYEDVFNDAATFEEGKDFEVEEIVPESPEEVDSLLMELRREGVIK